MSEVSRRQVAKGAAWSIPAVTVAAAAPAMAASPCAAIKVNTPLPASAFTTTYLCDTNETFGDGITPKQLAVDFGFRVSADAMNCGVKGSITSSNNSGTSYVQLSNGTTYRATNGQGVPANGTVGTVDTGCRSGLGGTQACGTSGASAYNIAGATNTSGLHVTGISLYRSITVSGYGTTVVYLNASGFGTTPGQNDCATTLTATATPVFSA